MDHREGQKSLVCVFHGVDNDKMDSVIQHVNKWITNKKETDETICVMTRIV